MNDLEATERPTTPLQPEEKIQHDNPITNEKYLVHAFVEGKEKPTPNTFVNTPAEQEIIVDKLLDNKTHFSLFAALFGVFYFAYRKLYIEAVCIIVLEILVLLIPHFNIAISLMLIPFFGVAFYPLYRRHINDTVGKVREIHSPEKAEQYIREIGGIDVSTVVTLGFISLLMLCIITAMRF